MTLTEEVLTPTSAAEWPKASEPEPVTLPSGAVVVLRNPNVYVLMRSGEVPPKVTKLGLKYGPGELPEGEDMLTVLDWMVSVSFVDPPCSFTRRKGCLWIGNVSDDDKAFVIEHLGLKAG